MTATTIEPLSWPTRASWLAMVASCVLSMLAVSGLAKCGSGMPTREPPPLFAPVDASPPNETPQMVDAMPVTGCVSCSQTAPSACTPSRCACTDGVCCCRGS